MHRLLLRALQVDSSRYRHRNSAASLQAIFEKSGVIVLFGVFVIVPFGVFVVVFLVLLWLCFWCFCGGVCCGSVLDM